jgi:hypothetical protein
VATENSIRGVTPEVSLPKTGSEGCAAELDIDEEALASGGANVSGRDRPILACVWRITDFPRISNSPHTGCGAP